MYWYEIDIGVSTYFTQDYLISEPSENLDLNENTENMSGEVD